MIGQKQFIRVSSGEPNTLIMNEVGLKNGNIFRNCIYDDKATPIPGFLPIRQTAMSDCYYANTEAVYYVNVSEIVYILIDDNNSNDLRRDMLNTFTEKRISDR